MTIRALQLLRPQWRELEITERIARASRWLATITARSSEERAMQLLGLRWAGASAITLNGVRDRILADQRSDGGWTQIDTRTSDAYATGQALIALSQAGGLPVTAPAYRRGVDFLLRSRREDGTWLVETRRTRTEGLPYFETGFPHGKHQLISYAATAWATMALMISLDGTPSHAIVGSPAVEAREDQWAAITNGDPLTPLMTAALHRSTAEVDRIVAAGADVNAVTQASLTALMCATPNPATVQRLLKSGADPNARAKSGHTALTLAAGYDGAMESVQLLLARGADPNAMVTQGILVGATTLTKAVMRGDTAVVQLLLDRGASVELSMGLSVFPSRCLLRWRKAMSRWSSSYSRMAPTSIAVSTSQMPASNQ
jgi:hypothetical protein